MLRGAARGLIATPWFAAAAGFVLAAGLSIYSPHAGLGIQGGAVARVPCSENSCTAPSRAGGGSLAITSPGVPIPHPAKSAGSAARHGDGSPRRSASAGLAFTFTVVWQRSGMFDAMISVSGKRSIGHWRLAFEMPGDEITYVVGANWVPTSGGSGGVASALTAGLSQGGNQPGGQPPHWHSLVFMVVGSGSPVTPSGCVYKGASCTFVLTAPQGRG